MPWHILPFQPSDYHQINVLLTEAYATWWKSEPDKLPDKVQPCCELLRTSQKARLHFSGHLMLSVWMENNVYQVLDPWILE